MNTKTEENGMIFGVKRFEIHDGDGIRTTLFLKGCPLSCRWCHNPEGMTPEPVLGFFSGLCRGCGACAAVCPAHRVSEGTHTFSREECRACGKCTAVCPYKALMLYGRHVTAEEILPTLLEDREFFEMSGGGVTLSGGEPLQQPGFCKALLRRLHEEGVSTALDTCGCAPWETLEEMLPYTDTVLFDVKAIDPDVHRACTGRDNAQILENLRRLSQTGTAIEIRVPFIPGWNDGEMEKIAAFLAPLPNIRRVRVLAYHDFAADKYAAIGKPERFTQIALPEADALRAARELLER